MRAMSVPFGHHTGKLYFDCTRTRGSKKLSQVPTLSIYLPIHQGCRNGYIIDPISFLKGWEALGLLSAAISRPIFWKIDH